MSAAAFRILAGPFTASESWMLDRIATDLRRGGIAYEVRDLPNGDREIWRCGTGWREVIDIETEEVASRP